MANLKALGFSNSTGRPARVNSDDVFEIDGNLVIGGSIVSDGNNVVLNNQEVLVKDKLISLGVPDIKEVTQSSNVISLTAHGLTDNDVVLFYSEGTSAMSLASYAVDVIDTNTFQLKDPQADPPAALALTGDAFFVSGAVSSSTANGAGITVPTGGDSNGPTSESIVWSSSSDQWDISGNINIPAGKQFYIGGSALDTDDVAEGANLYHTSARVRNALSASGDLSYTLATGEFSVTTYKSADFDTDLASKDTGDLAEGTNLYFTDARARGALSLATVTGPDVQLLQYNGTSGVLSVELSDIFAQFSAGTGLSWDGGGEFSFTGDTDDVSEGTTNLYWTVARGEAMFDNKLAAADTDDLSEGATNVYFTDARARLAVSSSTTQLAYNNSNGQFSLSLGQVAPNGTALVTSGDIQNAIRQASVRDLFTELGGSTAVNTFDVVAMNKQKAANNEKILMGMAAVNISTGSALKLFVNGQVIEGSSATPIPFASSSFSAEDTIFLTATGGFTNDASTITSGELIQIGHVITPANTGASEYGAFYLDIQHIMSL